MKTKKKVFIKIGRVFSPEFKCCKPTSSDSDANQSQIIRVDADVDHSQIIGRMQSSYWGEISPIEFQHPCCQLVLAINDCGREILFLDKYCIRRIVRLFQTK